MSLRQPKTKDREGDVLNILDIGCNEGDLTLELANALACGAGLGGSVDDEPKTVTTTDKSDMAFRVNACGVDIDDELISRARKKAPSDSFRFECINMRDHGAVDRVREWLMEGIPQQTSSPGSVPSPPTPNASCTSGRFDLVTCFSVTMWIHLHGGDDGLRRFLREICSLADNLVIEPQPWRCYQRCKKRWRRNGLPAPGVMGSLEWRLDVDSKIVEFIEQNCGFKRQGNAVKQPVHALGTLAPSEREAKVMIVPPKFRPRRLYFFPIFLPRREIPLGIVRLYG